MNSNESYNVSQMLSDAAKSRADKRALIFDDRSVLWRELNDRINRVANALINRGIRTGHRVGILSETSIEYIELFLGAIRAGACSIPLPTTATPAALNRMINDAELAILAVSKSQFDTVKKTHFGKSELPRQTKFSIDFSPDGWVSYAAAISEAPQEEPVAQSNSDALFNIIYSSGTTETPKGIAHDHSMRSFQIERMGRLGLDCESVTLLATPLYSNTTLVALLPTLVHGGTVVLMPKFGARKFLALSERHRVTHTMLVPVQYQRILSAPDFDSYNLSAYIKKFSTGAHMPKEMKRDLINRWPGGFVEIYGQTEGGCTTLLDAAAYPHKLDTVGLPARGVEIQVLDEQDNPVPRGKTGEVTGRAVSMMTGYYNQPEQTERALWRDSSGRAFVRTGDIGYIDEDGFLHIIGRKKDVIISGGFNIHAADLERVLARHSAVQDVAVIGVPSEKWGETPLAFVVLDPDNAVSSIDLLEWANSRLGKTQRISRVEFRNELPRNAAGKIVKRALR